MEEKAKIGQCNFCHKNRLVLQNSITTNAHVYICEECAIMFVQVLYETERQKLEDKNPADGGNLNEQTGDDKTEVRTPAIQKAKTSPPKRAILKLKIPKSFPTPRKIEQMLDEYVIGQTEAKRALSVGAYYHYTDLDRSLSVANETRPLAFKKKNNILLIGPSGCGKTYLAETLALALGMPFISVDASTLTDTGYIGRSVSDILWQLLAQCQNDMQRVTRGMIYIDEIDKITKPSQVIQRDISGESVQHELLRLLSGEDFSLTAKTGEFIMPTKTFFVVCGGAFQGLDKIIEDRVDRGSIGFTAKLKNDSEQRENALHDVTPADLERFGFILEFIRRFHTIAALNHLSENDLLRILTEPKDASIKHYKRLVQAEKSELYFTDGALRAIARLAKKRGTGASAIEEILNKKLRRTLRALPSWEGRFPFIEVTEEVILDDTNTLKPIRYERRPTNGVLIPSEDQ